MTLAPGGTGSPRQLGGTRKSIDGILTGTGFPSSRVTAIVNGKVPKPKNVTDRKSTRLNSSHSQISYAVFCLKKKKSTLHTRTAYSGEPISAIESSLNPNDWS